MTSSESKEPKGSERSSTEHHRCTCGHLKHVHSKAVGTCNSVPCMCQGFVCDHSRCGWKPQEEEPERPLFAPGAEAYYRQVLGLDEPKEPEEPPLTPEEEEELALTEDDIDRMAAEGEDRKSVV